MAWGILTGTFTWGINRIARRNVVLACVAAPFLWVSLEFARAHLPEISFPWNLLGYSASANPAFLQITTLTGIYGLSFVMLAFNSLLAWADAQKNVPVARRLTMIAVSVFAILVFMFLGGTLRAAEPEPHTLPVPCNRIFRKPILTRPIGSEFTRTTWKS